MEEALAAQAITSRTLTISAIEAKTIRKIHNADISTSKDELQSYALEKELVMQAVNKDPRASTDGIKAVW